MGCLRSKAKQNKSKKIEALKTIFDSQQTQRVNQQPLAPQSVPTMMVVGNQREIHDMLNEIEMAAITTTHQGQVVRYSKSIFE